MAPKNERPPMQTKEREPAWRAACLAHREKRGAGASDHEAHLAAGIVALMKLEPCVH